MSYCEDYIDPFDRDADEEGVEDFCEHGNLVHSEVCDECIAAFFRIGDAITRAIESPVKEGE